MLTHKKSRKEIRRDLKNSLLHSAEGGMTKEDFDQMLK